MTHIMTVTASRIGQVGKISYLPVSTPPISWLECDGSAVTRSAYSVLFSVIGTNYGSGDGSTTFNIPDLRGEFVRGWVNSRVGHPDSGRTVGTAQGYAVSDHTHSGTSSNNSTPNSAVYNFSGATAFKHSTWGGGSYVGADSSKFNGIKHTHTFTTSSPNAGLGVETVSRNVAMMACIKF